MEVKMRLSTTVVLILSTDVVVAMLTSLTAASQIEMADTQ